MGKKKTPTDEAVEETAKQETAEKETEEVKEENKEEVKEEAKAEPTELEKAQKAQAQEHEQYLRLAAEYDNFRKRTQREKDAIYQDAVSDTAKKFLPVYDNLERALNQPFDPEIHNAVMHIDDESLGDNVVAEVFQTGFAMGDKVIRFAMVKVAN